MTEAELQASVVHLAKVLQWRVYHTYDSRHSAAGFPDLVLVRRKRVVFAELKSSNGALSRAQEEWLDALDASHAETFVWRPAQWANGAIEKALR